MERLHDDAIRERLPGLGSAWRREGDTIVGDFECADFDAAIARVNRIAQAAQRADHHPDILIHDYRGLRITLSTHSAGGITENDFALAEQINAL